MSESNKILQQHGFPEFLLDAWSNDGIVELLPVQISALEAGILDYGNFLVIGPTSCGKTFVGELALIKHVLEGRKSIYLVPFKALAVEKFEEFNRKYGHEDIGAEILLSTSDHRDQDRSVADADFDIAILTYEKFSSILVSNPSLVQSVGSVVVDEIQMISDITRGGQLELLITRIMQLSDRIQIIGLSAVVSATNGLESWLSAKIIREEQRPVPLREGIVNSNGLWKYVEWDGLKKKTGEENIGKIHDTDVVNMAVSLAQKLLSDKNQQVLVFANTVANTAKIALELSQKIKNPQPSKRALELLAEIEGNTSLDSLQRTLVKGIAFHNADMSREERRIVEQEFRARQVRCVVSTSTLSMGINLPASTVIISSYTKWQRNKGNWEEQRISVAEYKNMSGRAGRLGLLADPFGKSFLPVTSPLTQESLMAALVSGEPDPLYSSMINQELDSIILDIFASGLCESLEEIVQFLRGTFYAQLVQEDENWQTLLINLNDGIQDLIANNLLIESSKIITTSPLGRACATSGIKVGTFLKLMRLVTSKNASIVDLAYVASSCEDTGPDTVALRLSTNEYKGRLNAFVQILRDACHQMNSPFTESMLDDLADGELPPYDQVRAIKYQAALLTYVSGAPFRNIEDLVGVSSGKVRSIGSQTAWLADTVQKIASIAGFSDLASEYQIHSGRCSQGCTEGAIFFSQVLHNLHRAERENLIKAGYNNFQKIIDEQSEIIAKISNVANGRIHRLQQNITKTLGDMLDLERQQAARLNTLGLAQTLLMELYTAKGVDLESTLENILIEPFCPLKTTRITAQNYGEADLRFLLSSGKNGIIQVTAKDRANKKVNMKKAGDILQQSPELNPDCFICIGRPDFDENAIVKATAHAENANYKAIPIHVIAEMYTRYHEGSITSERVREILESETGYIGPDRI